MHLTLKDLEEKADFWKNAGIELPKFDIKKMVLVTKNKPEWVHFGAGNIFRAFIAAVQQDLLESGSVQTGIIAAEGYDGDIIDQSYSPFDNLTLSVTLRADGSIGKRVIASIPEALRLDKAEHLNRLKEVFRAPSFKLASMTITEKGYNLHNQKDNSFLPIVSEDFKVGPSGAKYNIGLLTSLLFERYKAGSGKLPLALVSMDNCSHNGDKLFVAVEEYGKAWTENKFTDEGFLSYIRDKSRISFTWSMIDKITPRPDDTVLETLKKDGVEGLTPFLTAKNTLVAPFVNAEEVQYLVIEDSFPNGKPPLEKAGVIFTDRETVDKVEMMKVGTCLNPLHSALSIFGSIFHITKIYECMRNPDLVKLIEGVGYQEGLPVVVDPKIMSPQKFIDEVVKVRFPNPYIPHSPQQIANDLSQKIPVRFGGTVKAYANRPDLNPASLIFIPFCFAGWLRYLLAVDDIGNKFQVSMDPLLDTLQASLSSIKLGDKSPTNFHDVLKPILSDTKIFGSDLYATDVGLGEKVEGYFAELVAGPGAVAATLKKVVGG